MRRELSNVVRGRVALVLCNATCLDEETKVLLNEASIEEVRSVLEKHRECLERFYRELLKVVDESSIECVVTTCINGVAREVRKNVVELYGSVSKGLYQVVPKRIADEVYKCFSIVDTLLLLGLDALLSVVSDYVPVALSMGKNVVVVSKLGNPFEDLNVTVLRFDVAELRRALCRSIE